MSSTAGNVGIGTTAPGNKLDVAGGIGVGASYVGTSTPSNGMIIQGNVGIGTTSPAVSLHVLSTTQGGTAFGQQFRIDGGTGAGAGLGFYTSAAGADRRNWHIGSEGVDPQGNLAIYMSTSAGGAPNTAVMLFNKDGNVGIGNTAPASKLGVTGGASIGATYGVIASPTSGLIIEGNVGIGTTTPAYTLSVVGNVQFATLATTTATNYLTTDSTGKLVLASGASAGVSSWGGSASSTQTYATGTATGIGLNITTANGVHTWTPTVTSGYEIPTTASTSAWNTAGAGSTVFFTRQGNWNVTSFDVRYMSPLGAYTGESQVWFITAKGGTIKNLYIRAVSHSMNNGTKFRVRVNGVDTNINVDLATSVLTGNDTVNTASVSAGDYITVKIDTASSSSGSIGNPTAAFEIAF